MFTLFDLMRAAQGGAAMENISRQFGLSVDQTRRSMEALMPAFALGFQRNAADPMGFANLLRMMGSGQYAGFFEQPGMAFSPKGRSEGNTILGQVFGPEVSRQVSEQAAAWAGVAPEVMRQMMPPVATMLMGGLFKSAASEGLADIFDQFAQALRGGVQAASAQTGRTASRSGPAQDPLGAWTDMIGSMWGTPSSVPAARAPEPPKRTPEKPKRTTEKPKRAAEPPQADPISVTPFAPWAALMSGMLGASAPPEPEPPEDEPEDEPPEESPPSAGQPPHDPLEFFSHMVETGLDAQQQYVATLQNVFDSYWGAKPQRR